ncbi:ADP-ribosylation factor-like protein 6-interacting protein 1 [Physella acuta]|uniref:ADP-ribosylation factor-like protein 6-interacting protein 1 n=1 Tax=Physella acuta TaxID=109671 RepID=UPI0027DE8F3D|nr:ADP-ribosylation factor-like protein 6-interacting protein 1 [Physella acuta]
MANLTKRKLHHMNVNDLSYSGGGESTDELIEIKRDLEGWREVLLPLESLLLWNQPYCPAVIVGVTTFLFSIVWYTEMSALTTLSLAGIIIGIVDFVVPFMGPSITGIKNWTAAEEAQFTTICMTLVSLRQDVIDTCRGLSTMRQRNAKTFFFIVMGILTSTAFIGNIIDNLFLLYLVVNFCLLLPGLRQHEVAYKYLQPIIRAINMLKAKLIDKEKEY